MVSGMGIRPWHGLGTIVDGLLTARDTLEQAKLDWKVIKQPITLQGSELIIPDNFATVRTDDNSVLGIVGNGYEILQNIDAFNFFDGIAERGDAIYETAGSLFGGRKIFITAKIPGLIQVGTGDDVSEKYVLLTNSHDGTGAVSAKLITTRVVCNNTLTIALRESGRTVSIRHSQLMHDKLKLASEMLGIANKRFIDMESQFNDMLRVSMTEAQIRDYLYRVFDTTPMVKGDKQDDTQEADIKDEKDKRAVIQILELHESGKGSDMARGTLWGAFNAITEWTNHYRTYKQRESGNSRQDNKLQSIFFGQSAALADRALSIGKELVIAGSADNVAAPKPKRTKKA
jgi:phage/plasmid-like protein (TIGR03299 family)